MKPFNVLGISCSPRAGGNTDLLLQQVLAASADEGAVIERVRISDLNVSPCDGCWTCRDTGDCRINDDMQAIYPKLLKADGIVVASPVHMGHSISGQAQVFLDRTFAFWHQKKLSNKAGASVVVSNRRGGISAIRTINDVFLDHHILIAGYATGFGLAPGDIRKDERSFNEAAALGKRMYGIMDILSQNKQ